MPAETIPLQRAKANFQHWRNGELLWEGESENVITTVGIDLIHTQSYGAAGAAGMNFIALSSLAVTETPASTTLAGEILGTGLQRAAGVFAHIAGTNTSTITNTFTATGVVTAQKAALFNAAGPPPAGVMNNVLALSAVRNLILGDQLVVTYTITIG